ncbi:MAG TPA: (2Fe-2S)-binding protein [Candidatus Dormibacteraeota bacterium]|nr:(2Fe-2S)-binding protein [Candidatus Dormibacteraeota bacterium]
MTRTVRVTVNGREHERVAEVRQTLADFLREDLDLTGTHLGCEHGVCGACTVLLDGEPIRACLMLAVQADGRSVTTIEGVAPADGLHPVQEAFWAKHGLQCGYCTPGIIMSTCAFLREQPAPSREEIREMLAGHLCRCTGYHFIVEAIEAAAQALAPPTPRPTPRTE